MRTVRPSKFEDIKGHESKIAYFREHVKNGTLPQFMIWSGEEGLGKTALAEIVAINMVYGLEDSPEKTAAIENIIYGMRSNANIKRYLLSKDSDKNIALEILDEFIMSTCKGRKILILDEGHGFKDAAQDALLPETDTGRIPEGLYIILLTTELGKLKKQLRSRAVPIHFSRLKMSKMMELLKEEVTKRDLNVQGGDSTLNIIATWAGCKPRAALSILEGFAPHSNVPASMLKDIIGFADTADIVPLIKSLGTSMTWGLDYIDEMPIDDSMIDIVKEIYKVLLGLPSAKLSLDEIREIRSSMRGINPDWVLKFLSGITGHNTITKSIVINAYIESHQSYGRVLIKDDAVLGQEITQKRLEEAPTVKPIQQLAPPNIENLLNSASKVVG